MHLYKNVGMECPGRMDGPPIFYAIIMIHCFNTSSGAKREQNQVPRRDGCILSVMMSCAAWTLSICRWSQCGAELPCVAISLRSLNILIQLLKIK